MSIRKDSFSALDTVAPIGGNGLQSSCLKVFGFPTWSRLEGLEVLWKKPWIPVLAIIVDWFQWALLESSFLFPQSELSDSRINLHCMPAVGVIATGLHFELKTTEGVSVFRLVCYCLFQLARSSLPASAS